MSVVEIKDLRKHFDDVHAVDGINLSINAGEFLVILGPSGCGKSTLMRMIAGLEEPTGGRVWINDRDVTNLPPRLRNIAMVFQSYALYPHMTVAGNIRFPLRAQFPKMTRQERMERVKHAASLVEIGHLLDRKPRQLSGGERQRVAIARALVTEPSVLLLDEPLSNLDAKLRATARDELKDFQTELGITTIFVTHDQIEAMGLGDRIVIMSNGRVQQVGTPRSIYTDPQNKFVATFIGSPSMNLLPHQDHDLGFRPENFLPVNDFAPDTPLHRLGYHVKRVEFLGADRLLYGHVQGYGEDVLTMAKLPNNVLDAIAVDTDYEFAVAQENLVYFDKQSGERIPAPQMAH